ncbi:hypothetical protein [Candidatus Sororendozoicomonas aggregata]|uniref:hypothetical protein n=1 Tax=Candidatus Sororendozoicomonas aggregata TaxID=3073239 RepID=UPI002ED179CF
MKIKMSSQIGLLAVVILFYGSIFPNNGMCGKTGDAQGAADSLKVDRYGEDGQRAIDDMADSLKKLSLRLGIEGEGLRLVWLPIEEKLEILNSSGIQRSLIEAAICFQCSYFHDTSLRTNERGNFTIGLYSYSGRDDGDGTDEMMSFCDDGTDERMTFRSACEQHELCKQVEELGIVGIEELGIVGISKSESRPYKVEPEPEFVDIGNQKLVLPDPTQPLSDSFDNFQRTNHNFNYLADFLKQHPTIKYIVDIGCGGGRISLLMQRYLTILGCGITVIPVDIHYPYKDFEGDKKQPINVVPAQDIAGACGDSTLFIVLYPYTDLPQYSEQLNKDIAEKKTEYYITSLIKNNPGCFVFVSDEGDSLSKPQNYIPLKLVYTKHYTAEVRYRDRDRTDLITMAQKMSEGSGIIGQLNEVLEALPFQSIKGHPDTSWPHVIFMEYLNGALSSKGLVSYDEIMREIELNDLLMTGWHIYRQDKPLPQTEPVRGSATLLP